MAMNETYLRHIQQAEKAGNKAGAQFLKGQRSVFNAARDAGLVTELPVEAASQPETKRRGQTAPSERQTENVLGVALKAYESKPHTPELVTATFQAIWEDRSARIIDLLDAPLAPVTPVDRTQEEIAQLEKEGRRLAYLPAELAHKSQRHILGAMFPKMQSHSVKEGNSVTNETVRSGWFDYEVSIDAPHLNTKESDLTKLFEQEARVGMNATEYIIAGQDSKLLTGKYLDQESTWSRLQGSRHDGYVVLARFDSDGDLRVYWYLPPQAHGDVLGGRSVGVKK